MALDSSQKYLVEEFAEDYRAGRMSRREMLRRSLLVTGSVAATAGALRAAGVGVRNAEAAAAAVASARTVPATVTVEALRPARQGEPGASTMPPAERTTTPVVPEDDPDIIAEMVQFPGEAGVVYGYLARPARAGMFPAIIVIHENRGLIEPNLDIVRRFAKEGFVALGVDLISRAGGTAAFANDPMQISGVLGQINDDARAADMTAGIEYLKTLPFVNTAAGFGVTGFCFGGGQTFSLAARNPDIKAAVPFYGSTNPSALANTQAAILAIYAENDTRITSQVPDVEAVLREVGRPFEIVIYPASEHAFFNNTIDRYNPNAARDAWRRAVEWFRTHLTGV